VTESLNLLAHLLYGVESFLRS